MNHVEVTLYFNELRLRALEDHLNFDGTTLKDELGKQFDFLYEQYVPQEEQLGIEAEIEQIEAAACEVLSKPLPEPRLLADHYTMTVCYKEFQKAMAASWFPGVKKIDDFTVTYAADRPTELSRCRYFIG